MNLGTAFLNEGIPEILRVNLLLTSLLILSECQKRIARTHISYYKNSNIYIQKGRAYKVNILIYFMEEVTLQETAQ